jgi:uncharacterized SAM-binding protein YcdF (DUF218 family)
MGHAAEITKRSIEIIVSPLGIMTILMACGLAGSVARRHSRVGQRLLICGVLLFLVYLFSPLSPYLTLSLEKQFRPMLKPPESPKINRIAVLAGYGEEHPAFPITSNVSGQTMGSISEGLRLYRLVPGAKLITSGGVARRGEKPVAAMMADFLQQMGVPAVDLIVEGKSHNTYENLRELRKLVGAEPFILVAPACDLRRALAVSQRLRMNPIPAPSCIWAMQHHPDAASPIQWTADFFKSWASPSLENLHRLQWAYHEYLGYVWYRILGRI